MKNNLLENYDLDNLTETFIQLYLAGMDTLGHLCGMVIYYMTQYKEYKEKFVKEILENADNSQTGLSNLPYLNAVIKETFRIYGPEEMFAREA